MLISSEKITTKERLQLCCKPTYKPKRVKNKGAVFLLILNYLIMNLFSFLQMLTLDISGYESLLLLWQVAGCFTLPIAGWLADAHM